MAWIADAAALLEAKPDLEWAAIMERAHGLGGARQLFLGLYLARELLGAPVPDLIWDLVLADVVVQTLAHQVLARLFAADTQRRILAENFFYLRTQERWWDKLRFCWQFAFGPTSQDLAFVPLPRGLAFLYFLLRPVRLALRNGLRIKSIP